MVCVKSFKVLSKLTDLDHMFRDFCAKTGKTAVLPMPEEYR